MMVYREIIFANIYEILFSNDTETDEPKINIVDKL